MPRVEFNKLIRDKVKEIIESKGDVCEVEALDESRFKGALSAKLKEEAEELSHASDREQFLEEYADLMVVLDELASQYELSPADIEVALAESLEKKGAFAKRHFLKWSEYKDL